MRNFDKMYSACKVCGLKYDIEPGFYTGAMFVSYAFSVAITIVVGFFLFIVFDDPDIYIYVTAILTTIILLFPVLFRYSRVIYLHLFGGIVPLNKEKNSWIQPPFHFNMWLKYIKNECINSARIIKLNIKDKIQLKW